VYFPMRIIGWAGGLLIGRRASRMVLSIGSGSMVSQAVRHAYADAELARLAFNDPIRLYGAHDVYPGLHEALNWLVKHGDARRVWYTALDLAPKYPVSLSQLMNAPRPVVITLRDVMIHREYVSLLMQVLLARAYHEGLSKPFMERVENILVFDEDT